ncbi:MAG: hypothetical protein AB1758_07465 [Candidatus Eremiobacterota bacterium]
MRRGFLLVLVLLVSLLITILALAMLSSRARHHRAAMLFLKDRQARALAASGLEEARAKLSQDPDFPPASCDGQTRFAYREDLGPGTYAVVVDVSRRAPPSSLVEVRSTGAVGEARCTMVGWLDVSPESRRLARSPNPNLMRYVRWRESNP